MSKKYFAKYLPVEGEIMKGDTYTVKGAPEQGVKIAPGDRDPDLRQYVEKVKLFLCSRDIQVGDKFNSANGTGFVCTRVDDDNIYSIGGLYHDFEEVAHRRRYSYKIIGEISPEATWVKDGDEFDEDQIEFWHKNPKECGFVIDPKLRSDWQEWVTMVKIKGPCEHFH